MLRIGQGTDVHAFADNRDLILGGVKIPHSKGLAGHSDADVPVHALMDALLGAAGMGDIGRHFPDTDPQYAGADSLKLLAAVVQKLADAGWMIGNVDSTIVAQRPKLAPYLGQMQQNLASVMGIRPDQVNIKATTEEKLGVTGAGEGMAAQAIALLLKAD